MRALLLLLSIVPLAGCVVYPYRPPPPPGYYRPPPPPPAYYRPPPAAPY